uniref:Uncharacterized protein n=1 Tax=Romanomermis culicivorax TaxID=13658 RepID=A0A915L396_ROMCU
MVIIEQPLAATMMLPVPLAHFATHGPPRGIPTDSDMEGINQLELLNLLNSTSFITDAMQSAWSVDLAKKYPHLPWVLLNEPLEAKPVNMAFLVTEHSSPAVNAIHQAVNQAGPFPQSATAISPTATTVATIVCSPIVTTVTTVQMLLAPAQQLSTVVTITLPAVEATSIVDLLHP